MSEYGCHVDLLPGDKPDGCVLDIGRAVDCLVAQSLKASGLGKSECMHWRPIADCASELSRAYALIEEMREAMCSTSAPLSEESFKRHMRDAQCHKGITSFDACQNCQRQLRVIKAIAKAEAFLAERVK